MADIFQHSLFRGDCVSQAFMVKETTTSEEQKAEESCLGQETQKMAI